MLLFLNDDHALFCLLLRSIGQLRGTGFCELFIEKRSAASIFISFFPISV